MRPAGTRLNSAWRRIGNPRTRRRRYLAICRRACLAGRHIAHIGIITGRTGRHTIRVTAITSRILMITAITGPGCCYTRITRFLQTCARRTRCDRSRMRVRRKSNRNIAAQNRTIRLTGAT